MALRQSCTGSTTASHASSSYCARSSGCGERRRRERRRRCRTLCHFGSERGEGHSELAGGLVREKRIAGEKGMHCRGLKDAPLVGYCTGSNVTRTKTSARARGAEGPSTLHSAGNAGAPGGRNATYLMRGRGGATAGQGQHSAAPAPHAASPLAAPSSPSSSSSLVAPSSPSRILVVSLARSARRLHCRRRRWALPLQLLLLGAHCGPKHGGAELRRAGRRLRLSDPGPRRAVQGVPPPPPPASPPCRKLTRGLGVSVAVLR